MSNVTRRPKRKQFLERRKGERQHGFEFVLPNASITNGEDFTIQIRRISMQEKAAVNGLSQEMQDEVYRRTRNLSEWQQDQQKRRVKPADQMEELRNSEPLIDAINAVNCAAWIDPVLVENEDQLDQAGDAWLVTDFSIEDRWAVFQASMDGTSKEAKSLVMFRPEPEPAARHSGTKQTTKSAGSDSGTT